MSTWWRIAIAWLLALALPVQALASAGLLGCDALKSAAQASQPSVTRSGAQAAAPSAASLVAEPARRSSSEAEYRNAALPSASHSMPCHGVIAGHAMTLPDRILAPLGAAALDAATSHAPVSMATQGAVDHAASAPHGHACSACSACMSGCHVLALPPAVPMLPMLPSITPEAPAQLPAQDGQGPEGLERPPRGPIP